MEEAISKNHQVTLKLLSSYTKFDTLASSSSDSGGKALILQTALDLEGHVTNVFGVWTNTNSGHHITEITTRLLERAIDKYNEL